LEDAIRQQEDQHQAELQRCQHELERLQRLVARLETEHEKSIVVGHNTGEDYFTRRVEWTISEWSRRARDMQRGESLWSPRFKAAGMEGLQLEFFPKGREKTTFEGFCSLFLWCPSGAKVKYQLWVGSFLRAPDEDEYTGRIGHGHSNFCPVLPEVNRELDSICVGVDLLEVQATREIAAHGLRLLSTSIPTLVAREVQVVKSSGIERVVWRIPRISERLRQLPRGASMWSPLFAAAGIRDMLLEFYPNGSTHTTKEGYCAFYMRCGPGVSMVVTLFVGGVRKGPIKTTFEGQNGKGLPDFCPIEGEIDSAADALEVGLELQHQPNKTLQLESC